MISIIIPVYNQWAYTKSCLSDLNKLPNDVEIIVVNNGSNDLTNKEIKSFERVNHIKLKTNTGFGFACNTGYKESKGDIVIFLNNDVKVVTNLDKWTNALVCNDDTLYSPTGGFIDSNANFKYETDGGKKQFNYLSGWCLFGKKSVFEIIKDAHNYPFWDRTFAYFEDTYLSFRAKKFGIKLQIQEVPIRHYGRKTSSIIGLNKMYLEAKSKFIETCNNENIIL
jgi:GT2 family glycosyltransferase